MRVLLTIVIVAYSTFNQSPKVLLQHINLKGYKYKLYRETLYSHDDNWSAEYFTIYRNGKSKSLCSSYLVAKRHDTTFIAGNYVVYKNKIEFTQHYYHSINNIAIDSMKTVFFPDKAGNLLLIETKEFKNGQITSSK